MVVEDVQTIKKIVEEIASIDVCPEDVGLEAEECYPNTCEFCWTKALMKLRKVK